MHLLDMPKPDRPRRLPNKFLTVITGLCLGVSLLTVYSDSTSYTCRLPARVANPEPVRFVTVTTSKYVSDRGCGLITFSTHQMPLLDLYAELRQIEDKAEMEAQTIEGRASNAWLEQIYLRAEKQFMKKYSLTEKHVAMIKREGHRLTHP